MTSGRRPVIAGTTGEGMEAFLVGLVGVIVGTLVAAFGVRVFFLLLLVWGFVAGFKLGAQGVSSIFGEGFAATVFG